VRPTAEYLIYGEMSQFSCPNGRLIWVLASPWFSSLTRIGSNPSSAAFNNTILSNFNWLNYRIVSESSGIAWRIRFESRLTSSRAT
jgi:hypothetical protein